MERFQTIFKIANSRNTLTLVLLAFTAFGLAILDSFKIVWIDETYFVDIAYQTMKGDPFGIEVDISQNRPVGTYGPIYFWILGVFSQLGDWTPFWMRLPNFLASLGVILLLSRVLRNRLPYSNYLWFLPFLLFTENSTFENAMGGRMEAVALLFAVSAYLLHVHGRYGDRSSKSLLVGLFCGLAFLTTPRITFVLVPLAVAILWDVFRYRKLAYFYRVVSVFALMLFAWIFIMFGGIQDYIDYFTENKDLVDGDKTMVEKFLFGGVHLTLWKKVHLAFLIIALLLPKTSPDKLLQKLQLFFISAAVIYTVMVVEYGAYYCIVAPLVVFSIVSLYARAKWRYSWLLLWVFLGFNISMFGAKLFFNASTNSKDLSIVHSMVEEYIPDGSVVVSAYEFYYALREKNCSVYYLNFGLNPEKRVAYHLSKIHPEFILSRSENPLLLEYQDAYHLEALSVYSAPKHSRQDIVDEKLKRLPSSFFQSDYETLTIYQVSPK